MALIDSSIRRAVLGSIGQMYRAGAYGWVQGSYAATARLNVSWAHPAATSFDLAGVIQKTACDVLPTHAFELAEQLRADVCRTLGVLPDGFDLEHWNDADGRTLDDVLDAIEATRDRLGRVRTRAVA